MDDKEKWKDVIGYKGLYQISNHGRVKSFHYDTISGRILKLRRHRNNYMMICLCQDGRHTYILVHRLVARMFLGSAPDSYQVNHKNGDRTDNHVENLEWVTCSENAKHSFRVLGRKATPPHGEDNGKSKLTCQEIKKIRQLYAAGKHTHRVLGKMFKVDHSTIGDITRRETWQHIPREEINE